MPEFLNDDRPLEFFTKMPSRTLLSASLEDIGVDRKSTIQRLLEMVQDIIKNLMDRVLSFFNRTATDDLVDFSTKTKEPLPKAIAWTKVARDAGIEVAAKEPTEEAPKEEGESAMASYMENDENRKKTINALGDKLFVKLGEEQLKRLAFVGDAKSSMPGTYVDFVLKNLERARNIRMEPETVQEFAAEVAKIVADYRQEEASFELAPGTQTGRDIVGDILYATEHGYYTEHFKFKGASVSFKTSFVKLLEKLTEAVSHVRANSATEEDVAALKAYQESLVAFNQLFTLHREVSGALDAFLKLRKQYFTTQKEA
jgi:hypothetical protein